VKKNIAECGCDPKEIYVAKGMQLPSVMLDEYAPFQLARHDVPPMTLLGG